MPIRQPQRPERLRDMARSAPSALAEIRENEAPPEVAALYDDIRRVTALPVVNLIYRHFATLPGVLPWIWGLVRPALQSGQVDEGVLGDAA